LVSGASAALWLSTDTPISLENGYRYTGSHVQKVPQTDAPFLNDATDECGQKTA
jgi:hypothetical protein